MVGDSVTNALAQQANSSCQRGRSTAVLDSRSVPGFAPPPPYALADAVPQARAVEFCPGSVKTTVFLFGLTHADAKLWSIVAFARELPDVQPEAYTAMVQDSKERGNTPLRKNQRGDTSACDGIVSLDWVSMRRLRKYGEQRLMYETFPPTCARSAWDIDIYADGHGSGLRHAGRAR